MREGDILEEAEYVLGKRWQKWDEGEILDFLETLRPENIDRPLFIRWVIQYHEFVPIPVFTYVAKHFRVEGSERVQADDEASVEDLRRKMVRKGLLSP